MPKPNKTLGLILLLVLLVFTSGIVFFIKNPSNEEVASEPEPISANQNDINNQAGDESANSTGQYTEYSEAKLSNTYDRHILFFHASWCPECRAFEAELTKGNIPNDIQILKVDYDTQTNLKQKYGVTIQTTFVEVDRNGDIVSKWVGYSEDKSITALLAGLEG